MLEAAMFGGIPDGGYRYAYAPHQFMQPGGSYPRPPPHPPSPSLAAQRLIREQQVCFLCPHLKVKVLNFWFTSNNL